MTRGTVSAAKISKYFEVSNPRRANSGRWVMRFTRPVLIVRTTSVYGTAGSTRMRSRRSQSESVPKADWMPSSAAPTGTTSHHEPMKPISPRRDRIGPRAGSSSVLIWRHRHQLWPTHSRSKRLGGQPSGATRAAGS
jgi:hypothetical protein